MTSGKLWILCMLIAGANAFAFTPPSDILEAMDLCDKSDLRPVEGIWTFPEDDVSVMIFRDVDRQGQYGIWVVESADCSLSPRDRIGTLHDSPDPNKFNLSLYTRVQKGILNTPCNASAVLNQNNESITVTKPSIKISLYPGRLLSGFWRMVRLGINKAANIPEGIIKVYPSYDGNDSSKRSPRYL